MRSFAGIGLCAIGLVALFSLPLWSQNAGKGQKAKKDSKYKPQSVDEEYVFANLERFLNPSSMKILDDGRVTLTFDFRDRAEEHATIFQPVISAKIQSRFRWSLDSEYIVGAGLDDRGIRISNRGMALLNCWFANKLEAEITFVNGINFNKRMYASVIYCNDKGAAIGSNLGTQCAVYSKGRPKGVQGKLEPVVDGTTIKNKLVVLDESFEAHRNGRKKTTLNYKPKSFETGRVGFVWGGNLMAVISSLTVTGKIDAKKMAKFIQKEL